MTRTIKTLLISVIAFLFTSGSAYAVIFGGSVDEDDPNSVGFCLQYPDHPTCIDSEYGTICKNPEFQEDVRCLSEAQIGTELAEESLRATGITHTEDVGDLIIKYVNFILPYLALAAFVGFVAAGFFYVTAYGNEEQLQKAKKILIWSVVGLLLVIASYTIIQFLTVGLLGRL